MTQTQELQVCPLCPPGNSQPHWLAQGAPPAMLPGVGLEGVDVRGDHPCCSLHPQSPKAALFQPPAAISRPRNSSGPRLWPIQSPPSTVTSSCLCFSPMGSSLNLKSPERQGEGGGPGKKERLVSGPSRRTPSIGCLGTSPPRPGAGRREPRTKLRKSHSDFHFSSRVCHRSPPFWKN